MDQKPESLTKAIFICKSDLLLETVCSKLQAEYNLPLFVFEEHSTWEYAISHNTGIKFNVTKTEGLETLATWNTAIPDNANYQIIVNIISDKYLIQDIKRLLEGTFLTDIIQIQNS